MQKKKKIKNKKKNKWNKMFFLCEIIGSENVVINCLS